MQQLFNCLRVFTLATVLGGAHLSSSHAKVITPPSIDGSISYSSATASEYGSRGENWVENGALDQNGTRWFLTFDDTYLYIGVQGVAQADPAVLYFNTNPATGLAVGAEDNTIRLPFAADVTIRVGATAAESFVQLPIQSGKDFTWGPATPPDPLAADVASNGTTREMRIKWSSITGGAKPSTFEWLGYLRAALRNPIPATNTNPSEYAYYYNVYTPSNAPTFERLSYTAAQTATAAPSGTFFNYAVNAGKRNLALSGDVRVTGTLYVRNTTIQTGGHTVTLDQYATLDEEENNQVNRNNNGYISGKVAMLATLDKDSVYSFGNMGLALAVKALTNGIAYPGSTLVTRLTGQTYTGSTGKTTVSRFFFVKPTTPPDDNLQVDMTMHYAEAEKNSIPEGRLSFFKSVLPPTITLAGVTFGEQGRDRTGLNAGNNTIKLSGVELQGIWTLAAQGQPLPVELTQFTAQPEAATVRLRWATAAELNNKGFTVQRQVTAGSWQSLGFVAGQGTTTTQTAYDYVDRAAPAGIVYYRLVQTDNDGKETYSAVATVKFDTPSSDQMAVYPSPANTSVAISGLAAGNYLAEVYNARGQRVLTQELPTAQSTVSVQALPAGIYTLRVAGEGQSRKSSRFVKQ